MLKGLLITIRHVIANIFRGEQRFRVVEYPDVRKPMPPRYKGAHRLTTHEDGQLKCVACMCCSQVCPAKCITIEAGELPEDPIEKFPVEFQIDMLRCIYCGFCVDACPKDAIKMDTGIYAINAFTRQEMIHDKAYMKDLMDGSKKEASDWYRDNPEQAPAGYDANAPAVVEETLYRGKRLG